MSNLLENTLGIIIFQFSQFDWPVPRGYPFPMSLRSWMESVRLQLLGKDQFFGVPGVGPTYDWPNPRGYPFPIELRTWLQQLYRYAGFDAFFGAPGQPPANLDQPNPPRGYAYP